MLQLTPSALLIKRPLRPGRRLYYEDLRAVDLHEGALRLTPHRGRPVTLRGDDARRLGPILQRVLTPNLSPPEGLADLRERLEARLALPGFAARACLDELLHAAVALHVSDLHLQPHLDGGHALSLRRHGGLIDLARLDAHRGGRLIGRLKAMAGVQLHRVDRPQEGRAELAGGWIRLSFTPSIAGEAVTVRLFDRLKGEARLEDLGFGEGLAARLDALSRRPRGLLLISGPSGAGKTTTLYTLLRRRVAGGDVRALTVEDPVEYRLGDVVQLEARGRATQADLLKAALRHDADVLVVGEARAPESVALMLEAAQTGHLVLATVHAGSPAEALTRLLSLGASPDRLAEVLVGALNQRLLRRRCCAGGCARCGGLGFAGRRAIGALLEADEPLRTALRAGEPLPEGPELRRAAEEATDVDASEIARVLG